MAAPIMAGVAAAGKSGGAMAAGSGATAGGSAGTVGSILGSAVGQGFKASPLANVISFIQARRAREQAQKQFEEQLLLKKREMELQEKMANQQHAMNADAMNWRIGFRNAMMGRG